MLKAIQNTGVSVMARKQSRVSYQLTVVDEMIKPNEDELKCILRAADEIIATAGRDMLAKILKGSRDKKVLAHGLDQCPVYGCFNNRTIAEIMRMIDWVIGSRYLALEYSGRLPMIIFAPKGWELYKPIYSEELHQLILQTSGDETVQALVEQLRSTNREVVLILLEQIAATKNIGVIRFLQQWQEVEVKKIRARINWAIAQIRRA